VLRPRQADGDIRFSLQQAELPCGDYHFDFELGMPISEHPHAWRQKEAAEPIGCADANRPADRLSFAARSSLCGGVGALNRFAPGKSRSPTSVSP